MIDSRNELSSLTNSLNWALELALGTVGTAVAVLAIAAVGVASLQGRIPARKGAAVILGCFILFLSKLIATGLMSVAGEASGQSSNTLVEPTPTYVAPLPQPVPYEPYAGASVPVRPEDQARGLIPN